MSASAASCNQQPEGGFCQGICFFYKYKFHRSINFIFEVLDYYAYCSGSFSQFSISHLKLDCAVSLLPLSGVVAGEQLPAPRLLTNNQIII